MRVEGFNVHICTGVGEINNSGEWMDLGDGWSETDFQAINRALDRGDGHVLLPHCRLVNLDHFSLFRPKKEES